jgi:hypothetical protein
MGFRTLVELNHDCCPQDNDEALLEWAKAMRYYMGNGDKRFLPHGVAFKAMYDSYRIPEQIQKMGDPT